MSSSEPLVIRAAVPEDLPAILAIFNDAVLNTVAVWNDDLSTLEDRRAWYDGRCAGGFPVLVADAGGTVAGYASYGPFRAFQGYRHTAELSVYVDPAQRGKRIGDRLLGALVEEARRRGVHALVGGIEAGNTASLRLHLRHGFVETARMPEVGAKFGRWLDLVFMQRVLDDRPSPD